MVRAGSAQVVDPVAEVGLVVDETLGGPGLFHGSCLPGPDANVIPGVGPGREGPTRDERGVAEKLGGREEEEGSRKKRKSAWLHWKKRV